MTTHTLVLSNNREAIVSLLAVPSAPAACHSRSWRTSWQRTSEGIKRQVAPSSTEGTRFTTGARYGEFTKIEGEFAAKAGGFTGGAPEGAPLLALVAPVGRAEELRPHRACGPNHRLTPVPNTHNKPCSTEIYRKIVSTYEPQNVCLLIHPAPVDFGHVLTTRTIRPWPWRGGGQRQQIPNTCGVRLPQKPHAAVGGRGRGRRET